jgi:predicted nucleic acid-binding protein
VKMQPAGSSPPEAVDYVLDSHAILAYLQAEPGDIRVRELLEKATQEECRLHMCVVNLGEVIYIVERGAGFAKAEDTLAAIAQLPIEIADADRELTLATARLKAVCPIAYADCFAAALAQTTNAILVTGDPEFKKLKPEWEVRVEWLTS